MPRRGQRLARRIELSEAAFGRNELGGDLGNAQDREALHLEPAHHSAQHAIVTAAYIAQEIEQIGPAHGVDAHRAQRRAIHRADQHHRGAALAPKQREELAQLPERQPVGAKPGKARIGDPFDGDDDARDGPPPASPRSRQRARRPRRKEWRSGEARASAPSRPSSGARGAILRVTRHEKRRHPPLGGASSPKAHGFCPWPLRGVQSARSPPSRMKSRTSCTMRCWANSAATSSRRSLSVPSSAKSSR